MGGKLGQGARKEIKLKHITFGNVNFHDLVGIAEFLPSNESKSTEAIPLQASGGYPSNYNKPISYNDYQLILKRLKETTLQKNTMIQDKKIEELNHRVLDNKQVVLYGPPGTSKTFVAKRLALSLISNEDISTQSDEQIKKLFEKYADKGQLKLVQFHPSYSYEDFIQGINQVQVKKVEFHIVSVMGCLKNYAKKKFGMMTELKKKIMSNLINHTA